ncbi:hypothetical protein A3F27_00585 [Candidatus Kaiserbacteria bacterium RIFCSPHIGHO2_12_FULL_53_13]|uniref:Glycosyl transferase family 1 domain-containing protein n=1 Tax=Candidatus Kaiserbacteria bacterium RIFCSPHIGHO2_12_FULL_53_13 TaxID=1798502 RepID=A0A1F6E9Y3_9BACT|nr:MAG: hypothetical protein A3F27_00585 [Candidatus Kaiserbacteria bacterium RIFCSPHIGHO2_12_FULL_53_13]
MQKIRVAIMSHELDVRPERTLFFRRLIEGLVERPEIELTLIHFEHMPDDPLYSKACEILLPVVPLPYAKRFLSFIRFCLTTKERFDIVHWLKPRVFPFFWLFPARRTVIMVHGGGDVIVDGIWTFSRQVFNYTLIWFRKYVDAMIAVSEYANKEIIYAYRVHPDRVHTIYPHLDPMYGSIPDDKTTSRTLDRYGIKAQTYFLYLGRPELHKNVGNLVSAYLQYRERNPEMKELLVLGGSIKAKYERTFGTIPASPFSADIHFLGYIPAENLPALYCGACALSFVTLNEGFGLPVIEAMACGTPVITSSVTSLPEVAGNAAIIVDPKDPDALSEALKLVRDPKVRATLIKRGLSRCRFFTIEKMLHDTIALYKYLIDGKRPLAFDPKSRYNAHVNLKTPLPEAIDKFSILTLKLERLPANEPDRLMIEKEYAFYGKVIDAYREEGVAVKDEWIADMVDINGQCWDLEAAIRQGRDQELGLEEVGRRALALRDLNKIRIARKNNIAQKIGLDFFEIKVDHASQ